jgi:hypothetical protein
MDHYHPLVQKENKLTQQAMENAREIYLRVELGNYQETQPLNVSAPVWKRCINPSANFVI